MSVIIVDNFVRYKFCTIFLGRVKIMTRICFFFVFFFAGKKENYFILYNKTTETGSFTQLNR